MRHFPQTLACAAALAAVALAAFSDDVSIVDGIAAEVDGSTITISEVMREARQLAVVTDAPVGDRDAMAKLFVQARDALIERQLILHSYEAGGQKLPEWVTENRVSEIIEERFGGDRAWLASALARERMTIEEWRRRLEEEIILGSMRQLNVDRLVQIRPGDVKACFETNSAAYKLAGPVRVAMIQLAPKGDEDEGAVAARAAALRAELAGGADFADAARANSCEAHASKGGDWGFVEPEDEFRTEIAQAVAALKEGEISEPITTPAGVYIVKKIADRADGRATLADVREQIEADLREAESKRLHGEWIQRLKDDARIRIYDIPFAK